MDAIIITVIAFLWFLPILLESKTDNLLLSLSVLIPIIGAAYNLYLIRRILREKSKVAGIMLEILYLLRTTARRSHQEFGRVTMIVQALRTEMLDDQEVLTSITGGEPKRFVPKIT